MQRLLTAAIGVPLALAAVFRLPGGWFFVLVVALIELGVLEYVRLTRRWAPGAPLAALLALVPLAALTLSPDLLPWPAGDPSHMVLSSVAALLPLGLGTLLLLARTPIESAVPALGILCFGVPYFALPIAALFHLQELDPWLLLIVLALVWLGDSAAYYAGSRFGRRKLARVVSPNKTWEGAAAGLAAALGTVAAGSFLHLGRVSWALLALGAVTSVAGQLGDLVESMIKRAAEVKDSGRFFPGHGGVLDRMDSLLFAAPVWLVGLWLLGHGSGPR